MIFWALGMLGLLAFFAIVVEAGFSFLERRELQNTADAAALAGARTLFITRDAAQAESDVQRWASRNQDDLLSNLPQANLSTMQVRSTVTARAASLCGESFLGFGEPVVSAHATARLGASQSSPGVFCLGVAESDEADAIDRIAQAVGSAGWIGDVGLAYPLGDAVTPLLYTTLRYGAGSGSNTGYLLIDGVGEQSIRECFRNGSATNLSAREPTATGVRTGPAIEGLQGRLEAARARQVVLTGGHYTGRTVNCLDWADIIMSLDAADPDHDGRLDRPWRCSPFEFLQTGGTQDTAVVLLPVTVQDFTGDQGGLEVDVAQTGAQYQLAYFWIDAHRTFVDLDATNWKFQTQGQGQMEIEGIFLGALGITELSDGPRGGGETVACVLGSALGCFLQLID